MMYVSRPTQLVERVKGRISIESKAKRSFGIVKIYTHTIGIHICRRKKSPVRPHARKPRLKMKEK